MAANREFLDWDCPALPAAANWLADRYTRNDVFDLSESLLVLPGARAGRRLLELLVDHATENSLRLVSPTTLTVGTLPEQLYVSQKPFADDLVQRCAWVAALKQTPAKQLGDVTAHRPGDEDSRGWLDLADLLKRQHGELAGDGFDFSHVAACEMLDAIPKERRRWEVLHSIQQRYLDTLEALALWDRQTARMVAIEQDECSATEDIVLIGTVDINQTMRRMLESDGVRDRVTALVHAPESLADRFDGLGCLEPRHWRQPARPPRDDSVQIADRPDDQATTVAAWLSELPGPRRADDVTIGIADETLVPTMARQMADCQVPTRWVHEAALPDTRPWRLLEAVAQCLESLHLDEAGDDDPVTTVAYGPLAALWRHPDFETWLRSATDSDPVAVLDAFRREHLVARLELKPLEPDDEDSLLPGAALEQTGSLLSTLSGSPRPLTEWSEPIITLLATIYRDRTADRDERSGHVLLSASRHIHTAVTELGEVPGDVAVETTAIEAIRVVLEMASGETIAAVADPEAIEMVGWLELPLDDAPVLAVVGVNEGHVPSATTSDLFLPDRLRQRLGILDNSRRIARDAYAVSALVASREHLLLIGGRQSDSQDPLQPSRLLLSTEGDGQPARVLDLLDVDLTRRTARLPGAFANGPSESRFLVPEPTATGLSRVSATAFGDFLACPYRFYLRHVLRLESFDDQPAELSALTFGILAHDALDEFGTSDLANSTDVDAVQEFLRSAAWKWAGIRHGRHRPEAVEVQVVQLTNRLNALAEWQVRSVQEGWRIRHSEESIKAGQVILDTPAGPLSVTGRIDRIDHNESTGQWRVIDYKTSNKPDKPDSNHRKGRGKQKTWQRLQLPLYRRLAREALGVDGDVQLGYLVLPASTADTGFLEAGWTEDELAEADEVAAEVAEKIVRGDYTQISQKPPAFSDELAGICQDKLPHPPRHKHWSQS
ncbi:MAG: PD-(D/E)XK nuclease family protein [Planctomycetales bacterium]|nr:PD-(D/E)XK nuclease family protein [Planctomycetales bacterium]